MARIIAIANDKGGVGKTTTTFNLGVALTQKGKRVLLIDMDAQTGNLSTCMGLEEQVKTSITDCLLAVMNNEYVSQEAEDTEIINSPIRDLYLPLIHKEQVDLIPADKRLSLLELNQNSVLKRFLEIEYFQKKYDFILVDCPPTLGMTTINAFMAADSVLIPTLAAYLSAKGIESLMDIIGNVRKSNRKLKIEGILLTMVDTRCSFPKQMVELFHQQYGTNIKVYNSFVPRSIKFDESAAMGVSNFKHNPSGKATESYRLLAEEVM